MSRTTPKSPLIPGWRLSAREVAALSRRVRINRNRIPSLLPFLAPGPSNEAWRSYVSPVDASNPNLPRLFYELALTISQFGGFIAHAPDGRITTWKQDGSGIKAILATMASIRNARKLPQIDITSDIERELAPFFIRTAFGRDRLDIMMEIGRPSTPRVFESMLAIAREPDGTYRFNAVHMQGLACRFPRAFGEDPTFYKKASLLLMTMEIALNQLGHRAVAETLPPADYRIPQILEGLGILRFSPSLSHKIERGHVFQIANPDVRAVRSMTVEAVGLIKAAYQAHHGQAISCAELDGMLYLLSRNQPLMNCTSMKPHMRVATHAF